MECTIIRYVAFSAPQAANVQPPEPRSARGEMVQPGGDTGSHCTGHTMPEAEQQVVPRHWSHHALG